MTVLCELVIALAVYQTMSNYLTQLTKQKHSVSIVKFVNDKD